MEAFIIAIVLMTALVIRIEHKQGAPESSHAIETGSTQDRSVDCESAVRVCYPDRHHIIQRDLSKPGNPPVSEDAD